MFKRTKMMKETRLQSKAHSPVIESLIFYVVTLITNFAQSMILTPVLMFYIFSDTKISEILMSDNPDLEVFYERIYVIYTTLPEWTIILSLFLTSFVLIGAIIYCKFIEKRSVASMGLRRGHVFREYFVGFIVGLLMMTAVVALCAATDVIKFEGINNFSVVIVVMYCIAYIIQGMSEELLFRGYYMTSLTKSAKVTASLILSSALFALMHLLNNGITLLAFVNLFMFGLFAGIYIVKRGNIWGISGLHSAWNFSQGIIFGLGVSGIEKTTSIFKTTLAEGFDTLNGGTFGPEGGLFVTLILFLSIGALMLIKQNKDEIAEQKQEEPRNEEVQ